MSTISERTDDASKTVNETGTENVTVSGSSTEYTEDTLEKRDANRSEYREKFSDSSEYEEPSDLEETKDEATEISEPVRKESRMKGGASMKENIKRLIARRGTEKVAEFTEGETERLMSEEQTVEMSAKEDRKKSTQERVMETSTVSYDSPLHDPLAGLEVYGVHHKSKKKTRPKRLETVVERGSEGKKMKESKVQDTEEKPVEADEKAKKISVDSQTVESKIDKATDLPDKSRHTQTKFYQRDRKEKSKRTERDIEASGVKEKSKERKETSSKRKERDQRRLREGDRVKSSKRKKPSSEKSTVSDEEEFYSGKRRRGKRQRKIKLQYEEGKPSRRERRKYARDEECEDYYAEERLDEVPEVFSERKARKKREPCKDKYTQYDRPAYPPQQYSRMDVYGPYEDASPSNVLRERPCRCHPQHEVNLCGRSSSGSRDEVSRHPRDYPGISTQRFEMPRVKKYLPMYQSPGLIEELKRHDRMRLIREREARRHKQDTIPLRSKMERKKSERIIVCHPPTSMRPVDRDDKLPYQETQAYKNVLCEFRKNVRRRSRENREDSIPLIRLSKKADKSKKVKQLYPSKGQNRRKSDTVKKFANKIIGSFKPVTCKKHKCKRLSQNLTLERMDASYYDYSLDPEVLSDMSTCNCSKDGRKSGAATSADETTDNNDSTQ
ncbi:nuclear speckle splicing regulatory protein 1-like [Colletes gigas]|uniref:nuclear speckle splicing regulatory protein 1-like n=1 Tax=Colletes gigas TaxID=935657 RepID=UPI001C9AFCF1|nr:nuclear speckle splicing regulatory protein 1-like [Colletes gigas]